MLKNIAIAFLITLASTTFGQSVVINEVLAGPAPNPNDFSASNTANANSLYSQDVQMQPPYNREYIELYNTHPCDTVDISCYTLGSNANSALSGPNWGAFTFPAGTKIPPLGFLIVGGNNAQVPLNDFNITQYRQNSFGVQYLCGDLIRWFLRDAWGWIALYNIQGAPVDAVYWNAYPGVAGNLFTEDEYQNTIVNTTACGGTKVHLAAASIPGIEYLGNITPGTYLSFQREQDGSNTWYQSPVMPTPRAPNGDPIKAALLASVVIPDHCGNHDGKITLQITPGGTGPYTVFWNGDTIPGGLTLQNLASGTYTVKVQDAYNCLNAFDTIVVPDDAGPVITVTLLQHEKCSGLDGAVNTQITGGLLPYTYQWNGVASPVTSLSGVASGLYVLQVTDAANCLAVDSIQINNHKEPTLSVSLISPDSCGYGQGKALALASGDYPPYSYQWNTTPAQTDSMAVSLSTGNYMVSVTDGICTVSAGIYIPLIPGPVAEFQASPEAVYIEDGWISFTDLSPGPLAGWLWDFQDGSNSSQQNPDHQFTALGTYLVKLTVTDFIGCEGSVQHPVLVKDVSSAFFPNAFTPDNDGINDVFLPKGIYITQYRLLIFDRWGRTIFVSEDPLKGWDGKNNGEDTPEGVYIWLATFSHDYGDNIVRQLTLNGSVTLLRR